MTVNQISFANLQETKRHNVVTEGETYRHNLESEGETHRHNVSTESLSAETNAINRAHYERQDAYNALHYSTMDAESARHNLAGEIETQRHNEAQELVNQQALAETKRANKAKEKETKRHDKATESIQSLTNEIRSEELQEEHRSNVANEQIKADTNEINAFNAKVSKQRADTEAAESKWREDVAYEDLSIKYDTYLTDVAYKEFIATQQQKETNQKVRESRARTRLLEKQAKYFGLTALAGATGTVGNVLIGTGKFGLDVLKNVEVVK